MRAFTIKAATAVLLSLVLAGCAREGDIFETGILQTYTACPVVAIPAPTGDITLFDPPGNRDSAAIDVVAHITNLRSTCDETGSRGCALANAAVELPDLEHPARAVVLDHHREIRRRLRDLSRKIGARDPEMLGDSLMLLMGGSYMARLIFPTTGAIKSVSEAARILIESEVGVDAPITPPAD